MSAALDGGPAPAPAVPTRARAAAGAEERDCARVRTALTAAIAAPLAASDMTTDFAPHRRRYLTRQQAMEASIGPLRVRLRAALSTRSPAMARLAAVDGVMAQLLGARERSLLATVPGLLEQHFERLHRADQAVAFGKDMQDVLLAELDLRLQPVEGLLDALRIS